MSDHGFPGYDRPINHTSHHDKYARSQPDLSEMEIRIETGDGESEAVKYYVVVFCGIEPTQPRQEDGTIEIEPLSTSCIVIELGRAFANLGVDLVYANTFISPTVVKADLLAIHEIWHKMSDSDKRTLKLLSPRLSDAIELMTPAYAGDSWDLVEGEQKNGDTQDPQHQTATIEENKEGQ